MSERVKKTTVAALRCTGVLAVIAVAWALRGASLSSVGLWLGIFGVLDVLAVGYTWWWYGDSEKAVALRVKAETKRVERGLPPLG